MMVKNKKIPGLILIIFHWNNGISIDSRECYNLTISDKRNIDKQWIYEIAKNIEHQGKNFGESVNETLPMEKYIGQNRLPHNESMMQQLVDSFNKKNNVLEELKNTGWNDSIAERIPHQKEFNYAEALGQPGEGTFADKAIQKGIEYLPEIAGGRAVLKELPVTSKGILTKLSKEKTKELAHAKKEYGSLFEEASEKGLTHAIPEESIIKKIMGSSNEIVKNSIPKYHTSLKKYLEVPTIENAHWAQSELGALQRHLDKISQKNGLTPSQVRTYKSVKETRENIKKAMFSHNSLGKNPKLALEYEKLANKYKENVIPYTSLEDLSEFEAGTLRPKTAVKNLLGDEQFMIQLAKKHPGIYLHTPFAKKLGWGAAGLTGIGGYEELKKLLHKS